MMVFLNGNNDLDPFGAANINQMEALGSTKDLNIVVQWGSLAAKTTKRLFIQKDEDFSKVSSPIVYEVPDLDMGDKNVLKDFIAWTAKNYPAKKYFIAVWNHGGGWHFAGNSALHTTDISWDEKTGSHITTEELGEVMRDAAKLFGHKVDLYASDACLMSMVEVAYEMYGSVEAFAGSQENEPGAGWPYHTFLKAWNKTPKATGLEVGKLLTDAYGDNYANVKSQSTFSVMEMARLPKLVKALKVLGPRLAQYPDKLELRKEASSAVRFNDFHYVDIGSVMGKVRPLLDDRATLAAVAGVESALKKVVYANRTNTKAFGLSIWWPTDVTDWSGYADRYSGLRFSRDSGWHLVLNEFFK